MAVTRYSVLARGAPVSGAYAGLLTTCRAGLRFRNDRVLDSGPGVPVDFRLICITIRHVWARVKDPTSTGGGTNDSTLLFCSCQYYSVHS